MFGERPNPFKKSSKNQFKYDYETSKNRQFNFNQSNHKSESSDDDIIQSLIPSPQDKSHNSNKEYNPTMTDYVKNYKQGEKWIHTQIVQKPNIDEINRAKENDKNTYELQNKVIEYRNRANINSYNDKTNERNYKLQLARIQNHEMITNDQLALNEQRHNHQMNYRKSLLEIPKRRNPLSNDKNAYDIIKAADDLKFDLDGDSLIMSVSETGTETNFYGINYLYSIMFSGVQRYGYKNNKFTIEFIQDIKPKSLNLSYGKYVIPVRSDRFPHILLVRVFNSSTDINDENNFISRLCPCNDCQIY